MKLLVERSKWSAEKLTKSQVPKHPKQHLKLQQKTTPKKNEALMKILFLSITLFFFISQPVYAETPQDESVRELLEKTKSG